MLTQVRVQPVIEQGTEEPSGNGASGEHERQLAVSPDLHPRALLAIGILIGRHGEYRKRIVRRLGRARRAEGENFPLSHGEVSQHICFASLKIAPLTSGG